MKINLATTLFLFLASAVKGQADTIKDSTFIPNSAPVNIAYSPTDLVTKISIFTINFANGKQGIVLAFMTKETEKRPAIRIDSIVLSAKDFKTLLLQHPYKTNVISTFDGGYIMTVIHWLSKTDIDFIKAETITKLVLTVNEKPLVIDVKKKSQHDIKKIAHSIL
ncbi:MAG TPA: hypothetical protein VNV85_09605 [Puia sp.]|nr:hypothetical protein [Puia sp.]